MLALNRTIQTLAQQLRGFSLTAKLLIGALMVILVMGLILVAHYAGRPQLVPLGLRGNLSTETRARAINYLDGRGVKWAEGDGDLLVPPDQKYAVLAQLTERRLITADQIDFNSILKEDSPFTDQRTKSKRFLVAKMNEVARMISEMSFVERASVVIDQPQRTGIGVQHVEPTASVTVQTLGEELSQPQADAIARIVAGSHAALDVEHVTVVDVRTGRALKAHSDAELSSDEYYNRKIAAERHARKTIEDALSMIPGVVVAVNAAMDVTEVVRHITGYEDPKQGVTEETANERTSSSRTGGGEPGVLPNIGAELTSTAGRGESMSATESAVSMEPRFPSTESQVRDPKGYAMQINASVLVPKSYFVRLYKDRQGDENAEPDANALAALVGTETEVIRRLVEPLIDTGPLDGAVAGTVVVSMFHDFGTAGLGLPGGAGGLGGGAVGGAGGLAGSLLNDRIVRSVGLAALALISLALMFMMVRKATTREEEMPSAEELVGIPPALAHTDSDVVGEASETIAAMEGVEIGEDDLRRQQMLEQINELAVNSPAEAAGLLRKWMRHHE
jgi:flagellar M-ring protein FliF